jgi:hypothetical protein
MGRRSFFPPAPGTGLVGLTPDWEDIPDKPTIFPPDLSITTSGEAGTLLASGVANATGAAALDSRVAVSVKDVRYGALGNAVEVKSAASTTNGNPSVVITGGVAPTAGDIGKKIIVYNRAGQVVVGISTISAIPVAGTVTMAGNASATASACDVYWGTDDTAAILAAVAAHDLVYIPPGNYLTTKTIHLRSNQTIYGAGNSTKIFAAVIVTTSQSPVPSPKLNIANTAAFCMRGSCPADDALYATYPNATGDYFISEARAFVASTNLAAGAKAFVGVDAGSVSDLAAGDWVHVSMGMMGWHPAKAEFARVASVSSTTVNLEVGLRNAYNNIADNLGDFFDNHVPITDPSSVPIGSWRHSGFRKVTPIVGAGIESMEIRHLGGSGASKAPFMMWCAIGCWAENIHVTKGNYWILDSQDLLLKDCLFEDDYTGTPTTCYLGNGANGILQLDCTYRNQTWNIEEGAQNVTVRGGSTQTPGGLPKVQWYCSDVLIENHPIRVGTGVALLIMESARVRVRDADMACPGAGLQFSTRDIFGKYPSCTPARRLSGLEYFDDALVEINGGAIISSANQSFSLYCLYLPVRCRDVYLGSGATGNVNGPAPIGTVYRGLTRERIATLTSSAKPTVKARILGEEVFDVVTPKIWRCININRKTIASKTSQTIVVVNSNTTDGGIAVDDVVEMIVKHDSSTIYAFHTAVVTAINTGTGAMTIGTAIPTDYSPVLSTSGLLRASRWA